MCVVVYVLCEVGSVRVGLLGPDAAVRRSLLKAVVVSAGRGLFTLCLDLEDPPTIGRICASRDSVTSCFPCFWTSRFQVHHNTFYCFSLSQSVFFSNHKLEGPSTERQGPVDRRPEDVGPVYFVIWRVLDRRRKFRERESWWTLSSISWRVDEHIHVRVQARNITTIDARHQRRSVSCAQCVSQIIVTT